MSNFKSIMLASYYMMQVASYTIVPLTFSMVPKVSIRQHYVSLETKIADLNTNDQSSMFSIMEKLVISEYQVL